MMVPGQCVQQRAGQGDATTAAKDVARRGNSGIHEVAFYYEGGLMPLPPPRSGGERWGILEESNFGCQEEFSTLTRFGVNLYFSVLEPADSRESFYTIVQFLRPELM